MQNFRQIARHRISKSSWLGSSAYHRVVFSRAVATSIAALLSVTRVSFAGPSSLPPTPKASTVGEKPDCIDKLVSLVGPGNILLDREAIARLAKEELGPNQPNDYRLIHRYDNAHIKVDTAYWRIDMSSWGSMGSPCKSNATYAEKTRQFRAKFPHTEDHGAFTTDTVILKDSTYSEEFLLGHKGAVCDTVSVKNSAFASMLEPPPPAAAGRTAYHVPVEAAARAKVPVSAVTFEHRECDLTQFKLDPNLWKPPPPAVWPVSPSVLHWMCGSVTKSPSERSTAPAGSALYYPVIMVPSQSAAVGGNTAPVVVSPTAR
jgi:hypothetical protein